MFHRLLVMLKEGHEGEISSFSRRTSKAFRILAKMLADACQLQPNTRESYGADLCVSGISWSQPYAVPLKLFPCATISRKTKRLSSMLMSGDTLECAFSTIQSAS